jgi:hypothetical protein
MSETTTTFANKCNILGELWVSYKNDPEFSDFIEYNDLGLPLAYAVSSEIIEASPKLEMFVNETFELLLAGLGRETDEGYESIEDLLNL